MKRLFRILSLLFLLFLITLISFSFWAYHHQDEVVKIFAEDLQTHIKPQIRVQGYALEPFENFPYMSVAFAGVEIYDQKDTLAKAQTMYFTFNISDLLYRKYKIVQLHFENSHLNLKTHSNGTSNFVILKDSGATQEDNEDRISFELRGMTFKNVKINYEDKSIHQKFELKLKNITSSFGFLENDKSIELEGDIYVNEAKLDGNGYFDNKSVFVDLDLTYWDDQKKWLLSSSEIAPESARFLVEGEYYTNTNLMDFRAEGLPTNLQTLLALLPKNVSEKYKKYKSHGKVNFEALIKGKLSKNQFPKIDINFGLENVSFYHPESKRTIDSLFLEGNFTNGKTKNAFSSKLELKKFTGKLENQIFKGKLSFSNFNYPTLQLETECEVNLNDLLEIYPIPEIESIEGQAQLNIYFDGKLEEIRRNPYTQKVKTAGVLNLKNIQLKLQQLTLPITNLNGQFDFKNNHLESRNLSYKIGQSDFRWKGRFENIMTWLFSEDYPLRIRSDFYASFLYFDEIFTLIKSSNSSSEPFKIEIPENVFADLSLKIDSAQFQNFQFQNLMGKMTLKKQALKLDSLKMQTLGGNYILNGTTDASEAGKLKIVTENQCENIDLKKLFSAFKNFDQDFIQARHLSGKLDAKWETVFYTDAFLNPDFSQFSVDIQATAREGKLTDFEPLQEMSKLFKNKDIQEVTFSETSHEFYIRDKEMTFSKLEVNSSLGTMFIAGTHDFKQNIDYRLQIPLKNFKRNQQELPKGTISQNADGKTNIFLKVTGTTDDFKIRYDTHATWQKIKNSLQQKTRQFKDLFRKRKTEEQQDLNDQFFEY